MFGKSISGNSTSLAIAEEVPGAPKTLPPTPTWYELEPNEYNDFGAEIATIAREIISQGRQRKRGTVTDLDSSAGFVMDVTKTNFARLAQGFMFANLREKPSTAPVNGSAVASTAVATGGAYSVASGGTAFTVGSLVFAQGFNVPANNGLGRVTASTANNVTTSRVTAAEATPPARASIESVGYEFASGDAELLVDGGLAALATGVDMTTFGFSIGEWIFVGGDGAANSFDSGKGYARIASITADAITFDKVTWTAADDVGAGKSLRIYFGKYLRNEDLAQNIVYRSYQLERTLGSDGNGVQSEYVTGAVANELTVNFATADKLTAELAYTGMDNEQRDGAEGVKGGNRVPASGEAAINTSTDVYRSQMTILDPTTLQPTSFFAYVSELTLSVNNNLTPVKVIGNLGSIDMTAGDFEVGGEATAIFNTVEAIRAVRRNIDVTYDIIVAAKNAGIVFDIPLMGVGGGLANVARNEPITIPLENMAAENENGYTLSMTFFAYLPDSAMGNA